MLQAFKDSSYLFPCSTNRPLTLVTSDAGGIKDTDLYVQISGTAYPAGSVFQYGPTGIDLRAEHPSYALVVKQGSQDWQAVLQNSSSFQTAAGLTQLLLTVRLLGNPVVAPLESFTSSIRVTVLDTSGAIIDYLSVPVRVVLAEQGLKFRYRLLTSDRQLPAVPAGFTFGQYRWRSDQNANVLVPTNWNLNLTAVGREKFIPGIGMNGDLELKRLYRSNHSILPIVEAGEYFTGVNRYYMPSKDCRLEIFPINYGSASFTLIDRPDFGKPIFVGYYQANSTGTFEAQLRYRYLGKGISTSADGWDPAVNDYQFTVVRKTKTLTINRGVVPSDLYVAQFPKASDPAATSLTATFDLPIYPIWQVTAVYLDSADHGVNDFTFNRDKGQITLTVDATQAQRRVYRTLCSGHRGDLRHCRYGSRSDGSAGAGRGRAHARLKRN
jgi:hypothetical protein